MIGKIQKKFGRLGVPVIAHAKPFQLSDLLLAIAEIWAASVRPPGGAPLRPVRHHIGEPGLLFDCRGFPLSEGIIFGVIFPQKGCFALLAATGQTVLGIHKDS